MVNVTNGKLIRLLVDDEPFDVRYGKLRHHERILDLRAGTLHPEVEWVSPGHRTVRVRSTRLVSLTQRAIAAISYEVRAVGQDPIRVVIQSELVANEQLPPVWRAIPRVAAAARSPLVARARRTTEHGRILLIHRTPRSGSRGRRHGPPC